MTAFVDFKIRRASRLSMKLQNLGLFSTRLMYWCDTDPMNFGDLIGPYLFEKRRGVKPVLAPVYQRPNNAPVYITVGSILSTVSKPDVAVVWGTGILRQDARFARPREIRAVRGPLTRARCLSLGYDCPEIFGDPGIVLPRFFRPERPQAARIGMIPHYVDLAFTQAAFSDLEGVRIIDVRQPVEAVIKDILACERLVSSSLHGVIVSHAYGRPCAWVEFGDRVPGDGIKFHDYFGAAGVAVAEPGRVAAGASIALLEHMAEDAPLPDLSALADRLLDVCPF